MTVIMYHANCLKATTGSSMDTILPAKMEAIPIGDNLYQLNKTNFMMHS